MPSTTHQQVSIVTRAVATAVIAAALFTLFVAPASAAGSDGEIFETTVSDSITNVEKDPTPGVKGVRFVARDWRGNCFSTDNCRVRFLLEKKDCAFCGWGALSTWTLNGTAAGTDTDVAFKAPICGNKYYRIGVRVEEYTSVSTLRDVIRYLELLTSGSYETIVKGVAGVGVSVGAGESSRTTVSFTGGQWKSVTASEITSNGLGYEKVGLEGIEVNVPC